MTVNQSQFLAVIGIRVGVSFLILGWLAKVLHWPYAFEIILGGSLITAISYSIRTSLKENKNMPDWIKLVLVVLVCVRAIFIWGHLPMPGLAWNMIYGAQLIALGYLYFGGHLPKLPPKRNSLALQIMMGFSGFCIIAGVMFKIMHWPGASVSLIAGVFLLIVWLISEPFLKNSEAPSWISSETILDDFEEDSTSYFEEIKNPTKNKTIHLIAVSLLVVGLLFKFLEWPGYSILIIGGILVGGFYLILSFRS